MKNTVISKYNVYIFADIVLILWCKARFLVTSGNLRHTSRVCLSLSLASPIGHLMKNKTSLTVSLSSLASSIGNLRKKKKSSPTVSLSSLTSSIGYLRKKSSLTINHSLLSFHRNKRTASYADTAVFISVQTGQNLQEIISMFYKSHPHPQEHFPTSHAKHVLAHFGFCSKSFFLLHIVLWNINCSTI